MSWARPIKRILLEKRLMLGIVGMTLLVDVGLYTFAVYPWTFRVATARERADAASQRLAVSQETLSVARGTMAAKDRVEADLLEFLRWCATTGSGERKRAHLRAVVRAGATEQPAVGASRHHVRG